MAKVKQLGYMGFEVSDLDAWERLLVDVVGMKLGAREQGRFLGLRMDGYEQRMFFEKGAADDAKYFGWEVATVKDLEVIVQRVRDDGIQVIPATEEEARRRCVKGFYHCVDPDGNRVELYYGPRGSRTPFTSAVLAKGFICGEQGVGHYLHVAKKDRARTLHFYVNLLGMSVSDYIREEIGPGMVADAAFLHCNERHHSLATLVFPSVPKQVHHIMVEVADIQDLGRVHDACLAEGYEFVMSLGMHPNNQSLSFYIKSPSGFAFEVAFGGVLIGENWSVKEYTQLNSWGHHPPEILPQPQLQAAQAPASEDVPA